MVKVRKLPVQVEAVRFVGVEAMQVKIEGEMPEWLQSALDREPADDGAAWPEPGWEPPVLMIDTLEGPMVAQAGDWIIRGVKGELYPCKPDIFAKTYEVLEG